MPLVLQTLDGREKVIPDDALQPLAAQLKGRLIRPDDTDYDTRRQIWNGMIDRRPGLILSCTEASDVVAAVRFAAAHRLLTSVRGGGHNIAGSAICEGGIVIDLSPMRGVRVDKHAQTAQVQGGALLGDVDHACQAHGLAVPTGINSTTGIAGLALGGGYGWLSRAYGHTVDNILEVQIVTADGQLRRAATDENTDLFWAIRGGGGNFGIVTAFTFQLHHLGPMVMSGPVIHPLRDAASVLRAYRDAARSLPDAATCWFVLRKAPPLLFLDPAHHGAPVLILVMAHAGTEEQALRDLAPLRAIGSPLGDGVSPHPFVGWQAAFDPLLGAGARNYWKSHDFSELSDDLIAIMVDAAATLPTEECEIFTAQLGGAAGRVDAGAMAYAHRSTRYTMNIHGRWQSPAEDDRCQAWVRSLFDRSAPLSEGSVYINFVPEPGETRTKGAFGANLPRLKQIKARFDPLNLFRANVQIEIDG